MGWGQYAYVYWTIMSMPTEEPVQAQGFKKPFDFTRMGFIHLCVEVLLRAERQDPLEAACFQEPHEAVNLCGCGCVVACPSGRHTAHEAKLLRRGELC